MSKVEELKSEIESLPKDQYMKLRKWFTEKDLEKWDTQIVKDSESEKLDFLVKEAFDQKNSGKLKEI